VRETPGYLAPEQAAGDELSPLTDVFGLRVTLGESVTDRFPYGPNAAWERRLRSRPVQPRRRFARRLHRLSGEFAEIVLACVEPDPVDRPTLDDVRRALHAIA
jgi:serine/threonine protein kinase